MISTEFILLGLAQINVLGNLQKGMSVFTFIIGDVGSGKTTSLSLIQDVLENIDTVLNIEQDERQTLNGNFYFYLK